MIVDKDYCSSSFLMYRRIVDQNKTFFSDVKPYFENVNFERTGISNSNELYSFLKQQIEEKTKDGKAALALSGGIDSAILASFMPKGSTAYTFKCVVPGVEVIDESKAAAIFANKCGLKHKIIEIYWEDFIEYLTILMKHKGSPIHSIEVQIYKAALQAKKDGFDRLIFGESADCIYGGLSNLLSKEWTEEDFINRYSFIMPNKVLKDGQLVLEPIKRHVKNGMIDPHEFLSTEFFPESINSYINASKTAGIEIETPYAKTYMKEQLDYNRIRSGENKYIVREVFKKIYPNFRIPPKTPMPRPMNEWFKDWKGPKREEFIKDLDISQFTGDQKWLIWCLERFLDNLDNRCDA